MRSVCPGGASADPVLVDPAAVLADPARCARDAMDRLARLVAHLLRTPAALVSVVDEDGEWVAGAAGVPEPVATTRFVPLSHSYCQYVVAAGASRSRSRRA